MYRATDNAKVAEYAYDSWGNILSSSGAMAQTNPFRYRGYYYDSESGFYYLQSRYYDPQIGRFISADSYASTGQDFVGYNMFAYCGNNPVTRADGSGGFWHLVVGGVIGGVVGAISSAVSGGDAVDVLIGAVAGVAGGVLAASGADAVAQAVGSAVISMASNAISQVKNIATNQQNKFNAWDMFFDGAVGLATGIWGGKGASYGNSGGIMAAGKQLLKRGVFDPKAQSYYAKVAHRMGGEFVFKPLLESLAKNIVGSVVITGKNVLASKGDKFITCIN